MAAQRAAARGSKRRLADAAAQRAERHETVGGHGRQCLVAVGPEPLAGEARVPGLQVGDVATWLREEGNRRAALLRDLRGSSSSGTCSRFDWFVNITITLTIPINITITLTVQQSLSLWRVIFIFLQIITCCHFACKQLFVIPRRLGTSQLALARDLSCAASGASDARAVWGKHGSPQMRTISILGVSRSVVGTTIAVLSPAAHTPNSWSSPVIHAQIRITSCPGTCTFKRMKTRASSSNGCWYPH